MLRQIAALAAAFTIGALLATLVAERKSHDTALLLEYQQGTIDATCQEDEPCWDCRTMGNRICGH